MTKQDIYNVPKYAGIYCIKNNINGKCYIGQAIKLRKRLLDCYNHYLSGSYSRIALYKAFKEYGIENFSLTILNTIREALDPKIKSTLDSLEKEYINIYDSYNNGYNSTLELSSSEETKENLFKEVDNIKHKDFESWVKAKHIIDKYEYVCININTLAERINTSPSDIEGCLKGTNLSSAGYIIARYSEDYSKEQLNLLNSNTFKS